MTDCVVCDGLGCEFCAKVTEEEMASGDVLVTLLLWDLAFWLALALLIGWLT